MNHHLFQPLLYQVAAGLLSADDCGSAIRGQLKRQSNASVLMAEVTDLDPAAKEVALSTGERLGLRQPDTRLRRRDVLLRQRRVEGRQLRAEDPRDAVRAARPDRLRLRAGGARHRPTGPGGVAHVRVVGGGPTGVEIAGELAIIANVMKREFSRIDPSEAKVILVDAGERVVPAFSEKLSAKAAEGLASLGVTVREGLQATPSTSGD